MTPATDWPPAQSYRAYLIRMWRSTPDGPWRASAQHVQTRETKLFADLESLYRFLHDQSGEDQEND